MKSPIAILHPYRPLEPLAPLALNNIYVATPTSELLEAKRNWLRLASEALDTLDTEYFLCHHLAIFSVDDEISPEARTLLRVRIASILSELQQATFADYDMLNVRNEHSERKLINTHVRPNNAWRSKLCIAEAEIIDIILKERRES